MNKASREICEVVIDGVSYEYVVRKSKRAKHILLHVDVVGGIEVVVPYRVLVREAERFLHEKKAWLVEALGATEEKRNQVPRRQLKTGEILVLLGKQRRLEVVVEKDRKRGFYVDGEDFVRVMVSDQSEVREVLGRWYRREARDYFLWKVNSMARVVGVKMNKLVISNAGSQWGSCTKRTGRISLHWRLLLGPREVADYVAVHEVAHLVEANHSKKYWQVVERIDPDYREHRKWLRKNGHTLVL